MRLIQSLIRTKMFIAKMSAEVFARYVASSRVTDMNEEVILKKSVDIAIKLVKKNKGDAR